jgi:hypothetical protein
MRPNFNRLNRLGLSEPVFGSALNESFSAFELPPQPPDRCPAASRPLLILTMMGEGALGVVPWAINKA